MKKLIFFLIIIFILIGGGLLYYKSGEGALPSFINTHINTYKTNKKYIITKADQVVGSADTLEEAMEKAKDIKRSIVINTYNNEWVYCDLESYFIITETAIHDFSNFYDAYIYAKENGHVAIYHESNTNIIWETKATLTNTKLEIPLILQMPELPRGCEVTSLAMILKYRGVNVSKMTLAAEVKKDTTNYKKDASGRIYYGNPYDGFVGDMYDMHKNGYGVYHGPIVELAKAYCKDQTIDLTGMEFEDLLLFVEKGNPVWIITNSTYAPLEDEYFNMWHTPTGIVKTTNKLHSVVITGFTEDRIYINDPLYNQKNKVVNREKFKLAWEQMGHQAMTIVE